MQQDSEKPKEAFHWGTPASILIHAAIAAALLINIPARQATPDQEQAVNVELVPPPQEKPEEKKPEEAKKEDKKPETPKPPEKPPEPPKQEAKKEEPPPPPPPPPPAPKQEEAKEQPKPEARPPRQELPVLHPVFEYGQKDTGPKVADKGNAAVDEPKPDDSPDPASKPPAPKPDELKPPETPATANSLPKEIDLPKVRVTESGAAKDAPAAAGVDEAKTNLVPETTLETARADPTDTAEVKPDAKPPQDKLKRAKTILSKQQMSSPRAQTAIGDLSREDRFGVLCASELDAQLRQGTPAHVPDILPRLKGMAGNVLSLTRSFRDNTGWYDITFRCEVDDDATKVESFAYGVGNPVPKSEWKIRGFPRN
jgi:hypothetical protein